MRNQIRKCILDILGSFSHPAKGIHILNGHMISRKPQNINAQQQFYDLLKKLARDVEYIRIEEAVEMISKKQKANYPLVAFTFDDGFMDCYNSIAPTLEAFGINAAYFINPNFVDGNDKYIQNFTDNIVLTPNKRPMRWEEIKILHKKGNIIGAHTMDHYMINTDNQAELEYQIGECRKIIEEKLKSSCEYFAFPYGRLEHANQKAIDLACQHYAYVFSQSDYKHYYSFNGRVINRRHFEPFWPEHHLKYFLSCNKK